MYRNILLPIDISEEASWERSIPVAVEYCRVFGARLHVLTVVPEMPSNWVSQYLPARFMESSKKEAAESLKKIVADKIPTDLKADMLVEMGTVYKEIIAVAERIDADLIVMQSHRPELEDYLLGPNAARVVRHSSKSVLVVR